MKSRICVTADPKLLADVDAVINEINEAMEGGRKMTISSLTNILYEEFLESIKEYHKEMFKDE